ncbi:hypothetical protein [Rhodoferax aquaticus]|uniref:Uncharacterized protein n=1 Tax=Rhodoferax aquaticus TaxID=2527691 RepID=A0A515ESL7_9BURK|nr:hypothetical protein [Rhodoferax aquaticus]QDL55662.1 hypothetical protein EXZ61_16620 [Rhodoferax aquaticus]
MHQSPNSDAAHWPPVGTGLWTRWWGYLVRWLVFGVVVALFQPVDETADPLWQHKAQQGALGLLFGFFAAVVFTASENTFNQARTPWKTWLLIVLTWLLVKTAFVTTIALL